MVVKMVSLAVLVSMIILSEASDILVPYYTVDKSEISVSGISSGGAMAVQFQMAYSGSIKGVGSIASAPYGCSEGKLETAIKSCMGSPSDISVASLVSHAHQRNNSGLIDNLDNLQHSRVFIWAGKDDTVVKPEVSKKMEAFYGDFMDAADIKAVYADGAQHTFPTENYGNPCSTLSKPYMGKCNYNGAYELLNFIHGNLKRPTSSVTLQGKFAEFNQIEFTHDSAKSKRGFFNPVKTMSSVMGHVLDGGATAGTSFFNFWERFFGGHGHSHHHSGSGSSHPAQQVLMAGVSGMDTSGYIYTPSGCFDSTVVCKIHVAFHGCKMGKETIGDEFARNAGYNEVGELNNIIIVYPQTKIDKSANPYGCWDWWGYSGSNFDTKNGVQMKAVRDMLDRLTGTINHS